MKTETATVSPKFQVVIPKRIREKIGLRSGEKVFLMSYRNRIEIIRLCDMRQLRGSLKGKDTSFAREEDRL